MEIPTTELPVFFSRSKMAGPRVVAFGGGHGLYSALRAFRLLTKNLTAVVTVADDGGSSGRLREEFDVLPPGDLRMALAALCGDSEWGQTWRDVIQHRFVSDGPLNDHSAGNLLITALWQHLGDPVDGLDWMAQLVRAQGRVLPMSSIPLTITADVDDGSGNLEKVSGQCNVATTSGTVKQVHLEPDSPPARRETLESVTNADVLNLGPGSWYTSVMPHMLVPQLQKAIRESDAVRILTLNLPGDTDEGRGMHMRDFVRVLHEHAPDLRIDYVLVDEEAGSGQTGLATTASNPFGARTWFASVESSTPGVHDSLKLAACYRDILSDAGIPTNEQW